MEVVEGRGTPAEDKKQKGVMIMENRFKFNANAREFVPRVSISISSSSSGSGSGSSSSSNSFEAQSPAGPDNTYYYYLSPGAPTGMTGMTGWINYGGEEGGDVLSGEWVYLPPDDHMCVLPSTTASHIGAGERPGYTTNVPSVPPCISISTVNEELQRIAKQVEYQFSDSHLQASDYMSRLLRKDPDGYISISSLVSPKKVKSLNSNGFMVAKALRGAPSLEVSEDNKKVRRKVFVSEKDKEDLQMRTVVVENFLEENCRSNLENIFGDIGRVRNVRICHPTDPNSSNKPYKHLVLGKKVHAFVEFEAANLAEKAVEKLNDEGNWRKGLRVRILHKCLSSSTSNVQSRSMNKNRKGGGDNEGFKSVNVVVPDENEQRATHVPEGSSAQQHVNDVNSGITRSKINPTWPRVGAAVNNGRGVLSSTPRVGNGLIIRSDASAPLIGRRLDGSVDRSRGILSRTHHQPFVGGGDVVTADQPSNRPQHQQKPRMPDGTRGFSMGRGKPICTIKKL